MTAFGQFLELSVPAPDIQASLDFYRRLGFAELTTGDIREYYYAVVTDGRIPIGLHASGIEQTALSFVKAGLAAHIRGLDRDVDDYAFLRIGVDDFHEAGFYGADGVFLVMMEARTFSPVHVEAPVLGPAVEVSIASRDPRQSRDFWERAEFVLDEDSNGGSTTLIAPGLRIGLRTALAVPSPALRFQPADRDAALAFLEREQFPLRPGRDGHELRAPEGTPLLIEA